MNIQQQGGGLRGLMSRRLSAPQIVTRDDDSDTTDEAGEAHDAAGGMKAARFPPPRRPALDRGLSVPHSMGRARRASDGPGGGKPSERRNLEERARESSDFLARLRQLRVAPRDAAGRQGQPQTRARRAGASPQRKDATGVPAGRTQTQRASRSPHRRDVPKNLTDSMATVKITNVRKALDDDSLLLSDSTRDSFLHGDSTRSSRSRRSLDRDIMRLAFEEEEEEEEGVPPPDGRGAGTGASDRPPHREGSRRASAASDGGASDRHPHRAGPRRVSAASDGSVSDRLPHHPGSRRASAASDGSASDRRASAASIDSSVNQTIIAGQQVTIDRLMAERRQHESARALLEARVADLAERLQHCRMRERALEEALEARPTKSDEMKVLEERNRTLSLENEELRQRLTLASELDDIGEMRRSINQMRASLRPLSEHDAEDIEESGRTSEYSPVHHGGLMESFRSAASSGASRSLGESSLGGSDSDGGGVAAALFSSLNNLESEGGGVAASLFSSLNNLEGDGGGVTASLFSSLNNLAREGK